MSDPESAYPKLPRNTVKRYGKPRGKYDFLTIHTIINTCPVLHVSFPTADPADPFPAMLPMLGFMASFTNPTATPSDPLDLYLHGYISSRLMKLGSTSPTTTNDEEEGLPLTVAGTHLDGLVLALTPNHHSYNYRSAILHGYATPVLDPEEKVWAMEKITNAVVADRWRNSRIPPTKTEMTSTQILRVKVVDASAKIRSGGPADDRADMKDEELRGRTWTGVVPTWIRYGEPVGAEDNRVGTVPEYIETFVRGQNERRQTDAVEAVKGAALGTK